MKFSFVNSTILASSLIVFSACSSSKTFYIQPADNSYRTEVSENKYTIMHDGKKRFEKEAHKNLKVLSTLDHNKVHRTMISLASFSGYEFHADVMQDGIYLTDDNTRDLVSILEKIIKQWTITEINRAHDVTYKSIGESSEFVFTFQRTVNGPLVTLTTKTGKMQEPSCTQCSSDEFDKKVEKYNQLGGYETTKSVLYKNIDDVRLFKLLLKKSLVTKY